MTSEAVARPATARQMAYIESLRDRLGIDQPELKAEEMTCQKAALMISELVSQENKQTTKAGTNRDSKNQSKADQGSKIKQAGRVWLSKRPTALLTRRAGRHWGGDPGRQHAAQG